MPPEVQHFEDFELDQGAYELRRAGRVVRLERIPLEILFLLVERRGQLVTRQQIIERVWCKDVFVDGDTSVNTAVRKIRQALKENPDKPRLLFTVAGKGYRFVPLAQEPAPVAAETAAPPPETPAVPVPKSRRRFVFLSAAAVLLAAAFVAALYLGGQFKREPGKVMLVVLPFLNLSGDANQEYFADGMTEEMITQLGSLDPARLGVIARTSAMQYKGARKDTAQIARELGVNYVLEGSIRRAGKQARITAQLIQTSDQTHIWAENFDRDLGDVIKLQNDVARTIAGKIRLTISQQVEARLAAAQPVDAQAHEAYLQGLQAWNQRTQKSFELAIADFQHAIAIQANYALAYAGLARVYSLAPIFGVMPPAESMPKAREAVERALALDSSLAEAHATLAFIKAHFEYDWPGAEREFRRALELNPSDTNAHFFYSNSYLSPFGRHDEALREMQTAVALDPLSPPFQSFVGVTYRWARRYDDALTQFEKVNRLYPNFGINHGRRGRLLAYTGRFDGAIDEETKARILAGEDPRTALEKAETLRKALAANGPRGYWEQVLRLSEGKENPPEDHVGNYGRAIVFAQLGEKQKALDCLEQAYTEHDLYMTEINIESSFDALRSEPRFATLLRRVGLAR